MSGVVLKIPFLTLPGASQRLYQCPTFFTRLPPIPMSSAERMAYIRRGRQQQGFFLRIAGLSNRRSQRPAIRFLRKAGADLMGFTTSLSVQVEDVMKGARLAWQEISDHVDAARCVSYVLQATPCYLVMTGRRCWWRRSGARGRAIPQSIIRLRAHVSCPFSFRYLSFSMPPHRHDHRKTNSSAAIFPTDFSSFPRHALP